jgi:hypothetical protein
VPRHQAEALEVEQELLPHGERAMRLHGGVAAIRQKYEPVIERAVEDVLAQSAPAGRRFGMLHVPALERAAHLVDRHRHERGVAVGAAALIGHPVGAEITLLEDMHGDAPAPASAMAVAWIGRVSP